MRASTTDDNAVYDQSDKRMCQLIIIRCTRFTTPSKRNGEAYIVPPLKSTTSLRGQKTLSSNFLPKVLQRKVFNNVSIRKSFSGYFFPTEMCRWITIWPSVLYAHLLLVARTGYTSSQSRALKPVLFSTVSWRLQRLTTYASTITLNTPWISW